MSGLVTILIPRDFFQWESLCSAIVSAIELEYDKIVNTFETNGSKASSQPISIDSYVVRIILLLYNIFSRRLSITDLLFSLALPGEHLEIVNPAVNRA